MNVKIERALLSVSDKAGILDFARHLQEMGVELLSTGGTAKAIREAGIPVKDVSEFTGFPEMLDGRVKTLTPQVHAGILYMRDNDDHVQTMADHGLGQIDLVCVNLYPFEETIAKEGVTLSEAIEQIDIGGPTMIRSAAKNMKFVTVVTDPADYAQVIDEMKANDGSTTEPFRFVLGQKVYARVAEYNAAIATYLAEQVAEQQLAKPFVKAYSDGTELRYGENSHQKAWLYKDADSRESTIALAKVLHGKEMSYNNYVDGDGALEAVKDLSGRPGVSVIKHTNPCGYATGETLAEAFEAAWAGDPISAFGSVIAVTEKVDMATAECLDGRFIEAIIAPGYDEDALDHLMKKKNLRILKLNEPMGKALPQRMVKQINGGLLVQDVDTEILESWNVPTKAPFDDSKKELALFGIAAAKHTKSNAIVLVQEYKPGQFRVLGMGAGQPNRVDALKKLSVSKAVENLKTENPDITEEEIQQVIGECVFVSEAFFPFADSIDAASEMGAKFIVQPGGSIRDDEVIEACNKYGIAMAMTNMRHFKH
ncbi:bifunctional phosphoribosylaminoimidazolecarboxamide formyltransferase/IMP cyclohydrolase [Pontiella sp.]|uniref:bifunctional phosphoribosylaminoimidazolecarboxamide formyltransferase/IMP cyclohydrolase n=1 Tax=Pontiella sp. TaxID=2837462 RepID=UPI0035633EF7